MAFSTHDSLRPVPSVSKKTSFTSTTGILSGALIFSLVILYYFTPWPSVLPIRYKANQEALIANSSLVKHVPGNVMVIRNIQYDISDKDAQLDIFLPPQVPVGKLLPLIVWLHGGDWISGSREHDSNYCKILAARGYVVASVDYSLAPEKHYPVPLRQVNSAVDFLVKNAERFSVNENRIFLGGNESGAQLAAQVASLTVNSKYASLVKIKPALQPKQLAGCILYNGIYDFTAYDNGSKYGTHMQTVLWCYSGSRTYQKKAAFHTAGIGPFITANFPPCYIAAGDENDFLPQSFRFASTLSRLNVKVKTCFNKSAGTGAGNESSLFNLDKQHGQKVLAGSLEFINGLAGAETNLAKLGK